MKRITPLKAIRKQCLHCMGGSFRLVSECPDVDCPLYPYRFGRLQPGISGRTIRIIRQYCLGCAGSAHEVKTCQGNEIYLGNEPCVLWPFRLGKNPNYSMEAREKRRAIALKHGFRPMHERVMAEKRSKLPLPMV